MANNEIKSQNEAELEKEHNISKEAETSVLLSLYMGLFLGMVPVIGLPVTIPKMGQEILFIGIILSITSLVSFYFIGTLFGMPKRNNNKKNNYSLNNSLVEIADWLTKIIIGLALINLKEIPGYLISLGEYVKVATKIDDELVNIYSIGIVIYFGFLGLYIGYNYMRLVLSNKYKHADNSSIHKELEIIKEKNLDAKEEIQQKDIKLLQLQSLVQEKEQLTKSLITRLNKSTLASTDFETVVKKVIDSEKTKKHNGDIKLEVNKIIDEAKLRLHKGLILNNEDPQKGQWKSKAISNERELKATVTEDIKGLYKVNLEVVSTNPMTNPLKDGDYILLALHNTFGNPPLKLIEVDNQSAELSFYSYGSFTVGAFADKGATELELDLADLPNTPSYFKSH